MEHVESLTKYITHFVDQLAYSGVENVVVSPGSRSTPLAMTFAEHSGIKHWIHLDERSAAFFALGMAKEQQKPVAIVCTSGTAAANYYPAIVEAYYSRIPLIVLTADRPHELRDVGAPQAIDQTRMFGQYVCWYQDMALPEPGLHTYARRQAARAVEESVGGNKGPVHLNLPFREPLVPDFTLDNLWRGDLQPIPKAAGGKTLLDEKLVSELKEKLTLKERGVIVVGPHTDAEFIEPLTMLASRLGVPLLADPLSGLRAGEHDKRNIIENYDALLKSPSLRDQLKPDYILRFGAMPVSKAYSKWVKQWSDIDHLIIDSYKSYREPAGIQPLFIWADPKLFCEQLTIELSEGSLETDWLERWKKMNQTAKDLMLKEPEEPLNEGHAVVNLSQNLSEGSNLFVGNSMPIRDVDSFFMSTPKDIRILTNRGANGIDGVVSTAIGAAVSGRPTTLLLGDVSFFHDLNGLWIAKRYNIPLTVVLINNNGGGIFSYLPQAKETSNFEELFGTPVDIDFSHSIHMFGGRHIKVETWPDYQRALEESHQYQGICVIELIISRTDHVEFHKAKWESVEEAVLHGSDE